MNLDFFTDGGGCKRNIIREVEILVISRAVDIQFMKSKKALLNINLVSFNGEYEHHNKNI